MSLHVHWQCGLCHQTGMVKVVLPTCLEMIEHHIALSRSNLGKCICPPTKIFITALIEKVECERCGDDMELVDIPFYCPSCRTDRRTEEESRHQL